MENKSPFSVGGSEQYDSDFDIEEDVSLESISDKKKKNRVSELWKKLFSRETDEPKEDQKSFLSSFNSFFGKLIGIDKEEDGRVDVQNDDNRENVVSGLRVPFLNTEFNIDDVVQENNTHLETNDELFDGAKGTESAVLTEGDVQIVSDNHNIVTDLQDVSEESVVDQSVNMKDIYMTTQESLKNSEVNTYDRLAYEPQISPTLDQDTLTILSQEDISNNIDHRYQQLSTHENESYNNDYDEHDSAGKIKIQENNKSYSNSEDKIHQESRNRKKLQKKTQKLSQRVEDLQTSQKQQDNEINKLKNQTESQQSEIFVMGQNELYNQSKSSSMKEREVSTKARTSSEPRYNHKNYRLGYDSEREYYQEAQKEIYQRHKPKLTNVEYSENKPKNITPAFPKERVSEKSPLLKYEVNTSQKLDTASSDVVDGGMKVAEYETKFEAKDRKEGSIGLGQMTDIVDATNVLEKKSADKQKIMQNKIDILENKHTKSIKMMQEYRGAIKQGVSAGIIMLVSFGIIVFIWSLLN